MKKGQFSKGFTASLVILLSFFALLSSGCGAIAASFQLDKLDSDKDERFYFGPVTNRVVTEENVIENLTVRYGAELSRLGGFYRLVAVVLPLPVVETDEGYLSFEVKLSAEKERGIENILLKYGRVVWEDHTAEIHYLRNKGISDKTDYSWYYTLFPKYGNFYGGSKYEFYGKKVRILRSEKDPQQFLFEIWGDAWQLKPSFEFLKNALGVSLSKESREVSAKVFSSKNNRWEEVLQEKNKEKQKFVGKNIPKTEAKIRMVAAYLDSAIKPKDADIDKVKAVLGPMARLSQTLAENSKKGEGAIWDWKVHNSILADVLSLKVGDVTVNLRSGFETKNSNSPSSRPTKIHLYFELPYSDTKLVLTYEIENGIAVKKLKKINAFMNSTDYYDKGDKFYFSADPVGDLWYYREVGGIPSLEQEKLSRIGVWVLENFYHQRLDAAKAKLAQYEEALAKINEKNRLIEELKNDINTIKQRSK